MGRHLISNEDRGTIVTPSQPHTGTEVQVRNARGRVQDTRNDQLFPRRTTRSSKKMGSVLPNDEMTTTARGSLAFFCQQNPTNLSQHHFIYFFYKVVLAVVFFFFF